jgi:hypothetical protein
MNYKVAIHHIYSAIHCNSIVIQLKQLIFNYIQLHYNYTNDVMLMSLIVIHIFKTCGIIKKIGHKKFEILISIIHYDC